MNFFKRSLELIKDTIIFFFSQIGECILLRFFAASPLLALFVGSKSSIEITSVHCCNLGPLICSVHLQLSLLSLLQLHGFACESKRRPFSQKSLKLIRPSFRVNFRILFDMSVKDCIDHAHSCLYVLIFL